MTSRGRAVQRGAMYGERVRTTTPKKPKLTIMHAEPPTNVKPMAWSVVMIVLE